MTSCTATLMDRMSFQRAGDLLFVRGRRGLGSRLAGGVSSSGGMEISGPESLCRTWSWRSEAASLPVHSPSQVLAARAAVSALLRVLSTMSAARSSLASSSSPPATSSTMANQLRGRRISTLRQSQGFAASFQALLTKQRLARVRRTTLSGQEAQG